MHGFNRAIWIDGTNAADNTVEGNMLGLTPTGNFDPGFTAIDSSNCITVQQGATYTQIGAPGDANRNLVSGCNHQNIANDDYPTVYTTIQNNITGLDPAGTLKRLSTTASTSIPAPTTRWSEAPARSSAISCRATIARASRFRTTPPRSTTR